MNDVGGSDSGKGLRAVKSSRGSDTNFEYDDEWDVGIGNLISDLDADIEKNNEATRTCSSPSEIPDKCACSSATTNISNIHTALVQSKATAISSRSMHIPNPTQSAPATTNSFKVKSTAPVAAVGPVCSTNAGKSASSYPQLETLHTPSLTGIGMDHSSVGDKCLKMKIKRTKPGTKSVEAKHEIVKSEGLPASANASGSGASKSSNATDSKILATPNMSSEKEINDGDTVDVKLRTTMEIEADHSQSSKAKAPKKASIHKKVKLGSGSSPVAPCIVDSRRDGVPLELKSVTPTTSSSLTSTQSIAISPNVTAIPNIATSTSAFVKTSPNCAVKVANQSSLLGNDLHMGSHTYPTTSLTMTSRSTYPSTTTHTNLLQGLSSSVSASTKVDKGRISPTVGATNSNPEKLQSGSPSCLKKTRNTTERNLPGQDDSSQFRASVPGSSTSIMYSRKVSDSGEYIPSSTSRVLANSDSKDMDGVHKKYASLLEQVSLQDVCVGTSVGTVTEPDCLGPCEPGTSVTLEGIVWHETENGVLVVNVTWRGKTYVGTLLDCTKNDWASPRFCDSPTSDLEMRNPKNRGKRGRVQATSSVSDGSVSENLKPSTKLRNGAKGRRGSSSNAGFVAPVSPIKPDLPKRKTRGSETENQEENSSSAVKNVKRIKFTKDAMNVPNNSQTLSSASTNLEPSGSPFSLNLIECPEPNCSKKYKHINGLRYHQSHAHSNVFVAEDSDSNLSTASATNLSNVQDIIGHSNEELGRIESSRTEVDTADGSLSGTDAFSAPTTPVKRADTELESKPSEIDGIDTQLPAKKLVDSNVQVPLGTTFLGSEMEIKLDFGRDEDFVDKLQSNESKGANSVTPRMPILTVPTIPFMSIQNRSSILGHNTSLPRTEESAETTCSAVLNREHDGLPKPGSVCSGIPISINQPKMGLPCPWQPHVHTPAPVISSHGHPAHITSTFHPQQNPSTHNLFPTSVGSNKEQDLGSKDLKVNSTEVGSRKLKHKKKKDKSDRGRDREREGKSRSSESGSRGSARHMSNSDRSLTGSGVGHNREERRSSIESGGDDSLNCRRNSGGGHSTENRDDPQSPAYSDISDANDSGGEFDSKSTPKEQSTKVIPAVPDLKKECGAANVPSGQNMSSFYSPFYSPHALESPYAQVNPNGTTGPVKPDRSSGVNVSISSADEQASDKSKTKLNSTLPPHLPGHMEDRRSPKMDYHAKYLPHQQHYYPYPYTSYHYEQPAYGLIPEHSYNNHRGIEEKEREAFEEQRNRVGVKGISSAESKPEMVAMSNVLLKQEPQSDRDRHSKNPRLPSGTASEERQGESKTEFNCDYTDVKKHGSSSGTSPFQVSPSSKQLKEGKREDRHSVKDGESKESAKHRNVTHDQASRHKCLETGSLTEKEKDTKHEGVKPTMETQGPPPPPTAGSFAYMSPGYLQGGPFGLHFDPNHPLYRQVMVPSPYPGSPYMHPSAMSRFPQPAAGATTLPEDLSRPGPTGPGAASKALDLLQHHAAQYYASHKIHELQERALKSPSPQMSGNQNLGSGLSGSSNLASTPASPSGLGTPGRGPLGSVPGGDRKSSDPMKDTKQTVAPLPVTVQGTESSRSPPVHHVHTHMHSHTHIGYPIIPTVPPQYSPHYGVLSTPPSGTASSVIPPFPSQKPT